MKSLTSLLLVVIGLIPVAAQQQRLEGKITYISGDIFYTSLGTSSGIRDSSVVYVMEGNDTSGTLLVIAVSSSSSACRRLSGGKRINVNSRVIAFREDGKTAERDAAVATLAKDSLSNETPGSPGPTVDLPSESSAFEKSLLLHGAIGIQYFGAVYSSSGENNCQPAISVNLRGSSGSSPFSFQVRGLLRSNVRGTLNPFARSSINRSRLHRLSLDYDDGYYRFSLGRVPPSPFVGLGYVDGFFAAFRRGIVSGGVAAGFEPGYGQVIVSSERRKAAAFVGISSPDRRSYGLTVGYSRSYIFNGLDRETAGAILTAQPSQNLSVYAQSEVDFRTTNDRQIRYAPRFTSLYGTVNFRPLQQLALGAGVTSWRPLYSLQTALALADSLIDRELRTNPFVSANVFLPERIMISGQFSPRTSSRGFGKEYLLNAGCSAVDLLRSGFSLRTTLFRNLSGLNRTDGLTVSVQRGVMSYADITARIQIYSTSQNSLSDPVTSRTFGLDISVSLTDHLSLWGSAEQTADSYMTSTFFLTELSWRF